MKILFVWHAAVEREYRRIFAPIAAAGHEILVVTAMNWYESARNQVFEKYDDDPCEIVALPTRFTNHVRSFWYKPAASIKKILTTFAPDAIYLNEEPFSFAAYQWVRYAKKYRPQTPIVIETNENMKIEHPFIFRYTQKKVFERTHAIAVISNAGFDVYKHHGYGGLIEKTAHFVDPTKYATISTLQARDSLSIPGLPADAFVVGYAGRVSPEKGLDIVVDGLARLGKKAENVHVCIAGAGSESYLAEINQKIAGYNLQSRFHFLGSLKQRQLNALYNLAECMVLPSRSTSWWIEQFGRVIVEAMACGTPVIGSSSGEIPFVIGNPELVFEEGSPDAFAVVLQKFIDGVFGKKYLSASVKQRAGEFSIDAVAQGKLAIVLKAAGVRN